MTKDYFKELYECKKELMNTLQTIAGIKDLLEDGNFDISKRICDLKDDIQLMEVDLEKEGGRNSSQS